MNALFKLLWLLFLFLPAMVIAIPNKVVIIRHGEKPVDIASNNLNCAGLNRALQLSGILPKFGNFSKIYVKKLEPMGDQGTTHARMYQTAIPFAVKYNIPINSTYAAKDMSLLAHQVLRDNGDILIVWDHTGIPNLAKKLGINKAPKWSGADFDSLWLITYPKGTSQSAILDINKEMITPRTSCEFR